MELTLYPAELFYPFSYFLSVTNMLRKEIVSRTEYTPIFKFPFNYSSDNMAMTQNKLSGRLRRDN